MTEWNDPDTDLRLDCQTCLAANTTACNDCVVTHLLANDAGPIEFVTTGVDATLNSRSVAQDRAAERASPDVDVDVHAAMVLLAKAGMVDDPPVWVDRSEFAPGAVSTVS